MDLIKTIASIVGLLGCYAATLWALHKSKRYRVNVYELGNFLSHKLDGSDEQQLEDVLANLYICNKWDSNKERSCLNGRLQ